jgi:hypothetical protein
MKYSSSSLLLLLVASASSVSAFSPLAVFGSKQTKQPSTVLYISSWGKSDTGRYDTAERRSPEDNIQSYLKAPEPVEAKNTIDGTVLVSGLVKSKDRTDQTIFDFLNNEESAFEFTKLVAFVDDEKFAKKRLLSRSARYTGLLDKLKFIQATTPGALPTVEQLENVTNWVLFLEGDAETDLLSQVKEAATLAKAAPSVKNIALLLTNAIDLDAAACEEAVQELLLVPEEVADDGTKPRKLEYTIVAVGKLEDHEEGRVPYKYAEFGSPEGVLAADAVFSRDEALRMVTECLQLEAGANKALVFSEVYDQNATEAKLIKGLRAAGYARCQEIDHMVRVGPAVRTSIILFI